MQKDLEDRASHPRRRRNQDASAVRVRASFTWVVPPDYKPPVRPAVRTRRGSAPEQGVRATGKPLEAGSDPPEPTVATGYFRALDGLRGIAIVLVLWHHAFQLFGNRPPEDAGLFWRMSEWGWLGVDLFFVVSGFLITGILLEGREKSNQLAVFWWRRSLRILPAALLYLAALALLVPRADTLAPLRTLSHVWMYVAYLGNLHVAIYGWPLGPLAILWSLAIEEQFYLVWPLLVRTLTPARLRWLCAGIVLVSPLCRAWALSRFGYPAGAVITLCRADGLALGGLLAVLLADPASRDRVAHLCRKLAPVAVLGLLAIFSLRPGAPDIKAMPLFGLLGYSWIALCGAVLVGLARHPGKVARRILEFAPLVMLGKVCYGLYLWHLLVGFVMLSSNAVSTKTAPLQVGVWLVATAVVVAVSWFAVERPFLHLKRLVPARSAQNPVDPVHETPPHRISRSLDLSQ